MHKIIILIIFFSLNLCASTPKLYKGLGDPVYKELPAVKKMSAMAYFQKEKVLLNSFIREAGAHKKLGHLYDIKRQQKSLNKDERQGYRDKIHDLQKQLFSISKTARKALFSMIKKNQSKAFRQLIGTQLNVFSKDPKSASAIRSYLQKLNQRKRLRQQREDKKAEISKEQHAQMLRSAKNLNGKWKGKSSDGSEVIALFDEDKLSLKYLGAEHINIFKGTYTMGQTLDFQIYKRKLIKNGQAHIRPINIKRQYELLSISKKELSVKYKAEVITLER